MKIGKLDLGEKPLFLAPMEDVTDPSFRYLCKKYGADMMYTEFVASEALIRDIDKTKKKLTILDQERPIGIQLYGHIIESMVESAKIVEEVQPDVIDINFGCPVRKIATRGAGAGLLKDIPKMVEMTRQIVKAVDLPVTVKTRLGWDDEHKHDILSIARQLQNVGIQALTIHGRTRAQMYKGLANWDIIGQVKADPYISIPIIGNGDIVDGPTAYDAFQKTNVDGIMIGRATYGHPWIFKEIKHFLKNKASMPLLSLRETVDLVKEHLEKSIQWKGEPRGIYEMRRHFTTYFKGLPNFKSIKIKLVTSLDVHEINDTLEMVYETYKDYSFHDS